MKMRLAVAALAAAGTVGAFAAEQAAARMDRSKLLIGAYSWKKAACDEAHVRDVKECGIDFIVGVDVRDRATLDLFAKHGVGVVGNCALSGWWGGDGSNAGKMRSSRPRAMYEAQLAAYLAKYDHPAIWRIALCDEPSALDLPYLGEVCDLIAARVPQAPAYLNLYPNYASVSSATGAQTRNQLGTATYREHIDAYCRSVPLDYISYDFYVYTPNRKRRPSLYRQMYDNFNIVADACRRTGRSFWYIPQVNSHNAADYEPTTENRLRFQAYSAMAFGAEAISWACWMPGWWTNNVLTASGEKTAQYRRLKTVNAELHRLGPIYMRYRSAATHYVGFAATNGLEKLNVPMPDSFGNGFFSEVATVEGSPLLVGEMVPRGKDDGSRALLVVASGDPFDYAPATRTVVFRVPKWRAVVSFGGSGPVALTREGEDMYSLKLAENNAVMIVASPPDSRPGGAVKATRPADASARQSKMTDRDGKVVLVAQPGTTRIVRAKAGESVDVAVDGGAESLPMAFTGAGKIVKKGAGTLVIGPGEGAAPVGGFSIDGGDVLVRGGSLPVIDALRAGEAWKVEESPETPSTAPEGVVAAGMRISRSIVGGDGVAKDGDGILNACAVGKDVKRLAVCGGVLRIAPREAGADAETGRDLIENPGFENRGAGWTKYVHDDGKTYVTQFSNPGFTYSTSSWAFGYTIIDGQYCGRLHNNGGFSTKVNFPSPGRYRLTLHMRSRTDNAANETLAFVKLANGGRLEIFRMKPPLTQNFIEYSYAFDMTECGVRELVITGLGLGPDAKSTRRDGRIAADISTMVDGVHLRKEPVETSPLLGRMAPFPIDIAVTVAEGARLALDVPGTNRVASLMLGGRFASGVVSSATHPAYISGKGTLVVPLRRREAAKLDRTPSRMDRSKLQIGVYCLAPYARTEAHIRDVRDCGVDFIYGVPAADRATLDLCAKYGLGTIATGAVPFWHGMGGQQAGQMRGLRPMGGYSGAMEKFRDHPAIWLMDYIDEPSALDYPYIGEVTEFLKASAPAGVTPYINLYPNYASVVGNSAKQTRNQLGTATYREHVSEYVRCVDLDYICFDFYLYSARGDSRGPKLAKFYENFRDVACACRAAGKSLWYIPQVNSSYGELWLSENMLRFQAYLAMAFGAEQIDWACWSRSPSGETPDMPGLTGWWTNNVLTLTGERTEQYAKLKRVNAEIRRLGAPYMKYRTVATHHGGFEGVRALDGSDVTVGEMVARNGNPHERAYFVLASDDPFDEHPAAHRYAVRASRRPRATGKDGPIELVDGGDGTWTFPLRSNECALIEE